jgi:hypothetical protein
MSIGPRSGDDNSQVHENGLSAVGRNTHIGGYRVTPAPPSIGGGSFWTTEFPAGQQIQRLLKAVEKRSCSAFLAAGAATTLRQRWPLQLVSKKIESDRFAYQNTAMPIGTRPHILAASDKGRPRRSDLFKPQSGNCNHDRRAGAPHTPCRRQFGILRPIAIPRGGRRFPAHSGNDCVLDLHGPARALATLTRRTQPAPTRIAHAFCLRYVDRGGKLG